MDSGGLQRVGYLVRVVAEAVEQLPDPPLDVP
jgi:hypothetical protein